MKSLKDFNVKNKKILLRADFNVSLDEKGNIRDDFRIRRVVPTINYLVKKNKAKVILMAHLGKPWESQKSKKSQKSKVKSQKYSLKPIALSLKKLLKKPVKFLSDCLGKEVKKEIEKMKPREILLLENLRFYKEEQENDENFAKNLASLGDIYLNDAFATCHRAHASIVGIPKFLPAGSGLLLEKEIKMLSKILENPERPLIIIIGGKKIGDKVNFAYRFLEKADQLLLGGKIANAILLIKGLCLGDGVLEEEISEKKIINRIKKIELTNPKLHLPIDALISLENLKGDYLREGAIGNVRREESIFDIGPDTIKIFSEIIKSAKTIFWTGPMGFFEKKEFENGTKEIAKSIAKNSSAFKIAGGGDTITALNKFGLLNKFDYISTGGSALLVFLSGEKLPGLTALNYYEN